MKPWRLKITVDGHWTLYHNGVLWSAGRAWTRGVATMLWLNITRGTIGVLPGRPPITQHGGASIGQLPLQQPESTHQAPGVPSEVHTQPNYLLGRPEASYEPDFKERILALVRSI